MHVKLDGKDIRGIAYVDQLGTVGENFKHFQLVLSTEDTLMDNPTA